VKLFVLDTHTIYRRGLVACLDLLDEVEGVADADCVREAWENPALFDADLVLVDPTGSTPLAAGHMATDYSPYEGLSASGRIVRVLRRGETVVDDEALEAAPGSGRWLPLGSGAGDWAVERSLAAASVGGPTIGGARA